MIKLRYVLALVMLIFLYLQAYYFGLNDYMSGILILINTFIMYSVVLKLQEGNKRALRVNAEKGGYLYSFLSKEKTIFVRIISFFISLVLSITLVIVLKGITLNHGIIAFFVIISIISLAIFNFLNKEIKVEVIDNNFKDDLSIHAHNFINVVMVAIFLNIILSIILSAHDVMVFLNSSVNFDNFDEIALMSSMDKTGANSISRPLMNLYILLDTFKIAVASKFLDLFLDPQQRVNYFYLFYLVLFFLNTIKLFAFSLSFVFLQKGFEGISKKIMPLVEEVLKFLKSNQGIKKKIFKKNVNTNNNEIFENNNKSEIDK